MHVMQGKPVSVPRPKSASAARLGRAPVPGSRGKVDCRGSSGWNNRDGQPDDAWQGGGGHRPRLGAAEGVHGSACLGGALVLERAQSADRVRLDAAAVPSSPIASAARTTGFLGGMWGVRASILTGPPEAFWRARPRDCCDTLFQLPSKQLRRGTGVGRHAGEVQGSSRARAGRTRKGEGGGAAGSSRHLTKPARKHAEDTRENGPSNTADGSDAASSRASALLEVKFKPVLIQDLLQQRGGCADDVSRVSLQGNGLQVLPRCVALFSSLRSLSVTWNELSELPAVLGSLSRLQSLDASFNRLVHVASELGNLHRLEELELGDNQLLRLPASFDGRLTSLRRLGLPYNHLEQLPRHLHRISTLTSLDVRGNPLLPPDAQQASPQATAVFTALKASKAKRLAARAGCNTSRVQDSDERGAGSGEEGIRLEDGGSRAYCRSLEQGEGEAAGAGHDGEAEVGRSGDEHAGWAGALSDSSADPGSEDDEIELVRSLLLRRRYMPVYICSKYIHTSLPLRRKYADAQVYSDISIFDRRRT